MIIQLQNDPSIHLTEQPDTLYTYFVSLNTRIRILNAQPSEVQKLQQKLLTAFVEVINKENETRT
jgi:hypothetical protein